MSRLSRVAVPAIALLALGPAWGTSSRPARASSAVPARFPDGNWPTLGHDPQRSGVAQGISGIRAQDLRRLQRRAVSLDGTVDSSPIQLHAVRVRGRVRDVVVLGTSYGRTVALDPANGRRLWEFAPHGIAAYEGGPRITEAGPVADPDRHYVYSASPDGLIHKLSVTSGRQVWQARVTRAPTREKISGSLNLAGDSVVVETSSYFDHQPYDGHVVLVNRATGRITAVWNAMCSQIHRLIRPSRCALTAGQDAGDDSIWARAGAVVEPQTGRLLVATGNGPFDGRHYWGDSVIELSRQLRPLHSWTPRDQRRLSAEDLDLGSTEPALLPVLDHRRLAVQGGKAGILSLLDLDRLDGSRAPAGPRKGGELQDLSIPGGYEMFSVPAVWRHGGRDYVFTSDGPRSEAYVLVGLPHPRLRLLWVLDHASTSAVVAGGLLYEYGQDTGALRVLDPLTGRVLAELPAAPGHWNSPIVVGGRIILPVGNANDHLTTGRIFIYHLPGR